MVEGGWPSQATLFRRHLLNHRVEEAWRTWSDAAEECCRAEGRQGARNVLTHYTPRAQVRTPKWDPQTPLYGRDRMTLRVRRILRVSRQLGAAQVEGTEEAVQRVWIRAKDVRSWNADLEDRRWESEETLRMLKRMAQHAIAGDEKKTG